MQIGSCVPCWTTCGFGSLRLHQVLLWDALMPFPAIHEFTPEGLCSTAQEHTVFSGCCGRDCLVPALAAVNVEIFVISFWCSCEKGDAVGLYLHFFKWKWKSYLANDKTWRKLIIYIASHSTWGFRWRQTSNSASSSWEIEGKQDPPKKHHVLAALGWRKKHCGGRVGRVWTFSCVFVLVLWVSCRSRMFSCK